MAAYAVIQRTKVRIIGGICTDAVENRDELRIALSVDFPQFNTQDRHLLPHFGIEEIGRGIEGGEQLALIFFQDRFQLENIANQ